MLNDGTDYFVLEGDPSDNLDAWESSSRYLLNQLHRSNNMMINDTKVPNTVYGSKLDLVMVSSQQYTDIKIIVSTLTT